MSLAHSQQQSGPDGLGRVLVVVPTYQEAANIETVLWRVHRALPGATVLVVDDGSPDGTADIAEATGVIVGNVELLRRPGKAGLGAAYRAGFRWGLERGFDVLVEMDADLSHDPAALPDLIAPLAAGADLSIGSRYVPGGVIPNWSRKRRLLSRWGNRYSGFMLGLKVADATAGFRAYRADMLRTIDLDGVRADGYGFQIEMAYRVAQAGGVLTEVPITFADREHGQSKMSGRIIVEALALVTRWGVRRRLSR
jgi:glycosyltransferase involved in cell wall biosynthesis